MAETLNNSQKISYSFVILDAKDRPAKIDGDPVTASSDETVATVTQPAKGDDGSWSFDVVSVAPSPEGTTQRATVTVDADLGAGVESIVGIAEFSVTLDPDTKASVIRLTAGATVDK